MWEEDQLIYDGPLVFDHELEFVNFPCPCGKNDWASAESYPIDDKGEYGKCDACGAEYKLEISYKILRKVK